MFLLWQKIYKKINRNRLKEFMLKVDEIRPRPGFNAGCSTNSFPAYTFMKYILGQNGFDWIKEFTGVNPKHSVIRAKTQMVKVILPWLPNK